MIYDGLGQDRNAQQLSCQGPWDQTTALNIFESTGGKDANSFFKVTGTAYAVVWLWYSFVGLFGYAAWGDVVRKVLLDNFPAGTASDTAKTILAVVLLLSFTLQLNPVFDLLDGVLATTGAQWAPSCWPLLRPILVGLSILTQILVPDAEEMVALSGSICFSLLGFILPAVFFLRVSPPSVGDWPHAATIDKAIAVMLVPIGIIGGVAGVLGAM